MEPELLKILRCPETHQELRVAESGMVDRLNRQIDAGTLKNRGGQLITEKFESGLVRDDGKMMYLIRRGIPVMLVEEAIPLG